MVETIRAWKGKSKRILFGEWEIEHGAKGELFIVRKDHGDFETMVHHTAKYTPPEKEKAEFFHYLIYRAAHCWPVE